MILLSVVIPVYRVEQLLQRCVDSVVAQNVPDMEIILVDDCSPDGSGKLCDEIAHKEPCVTVIHRKKNGGLSAARNSGIEAARGEFLTFVDSDDYISPNTFLPILQLFSHDCDCVEYSVAYNDGSIYNPMNYARGTTFPDWMARKGFSQAYAWNNIYRHSVWGDTRFPEGKYFEDLFTIPYFLHRCNNIISSPYGCYYYCDDNSAAITRNPSVKKADDLLEATLQLLDFATSQCGMNRSEVFALQMEATNRKIDLLRTGGATTARVGRPRLIDALLNKSIKGLLLWLLGEKWFFNIFKSMNRR